MANSNGTDEYMPWDRLRGWIDQQQAWEKANGRPVALTKAQVLAINSLVPAVPEPELASEDFVSRLNLFCQAKKLSTPQFTEDAILVPGPGAPQSKWATYCTMPMVDGRFPRLGFGIESGHEAPAFTSKKKGKQYAAKHALDYLMNNHPSSSAQYSQATTLARPSGSVGVIGDPRPASTHNGVRISGTTPLTKPGQSPKVNGSLASEFDSDDEGPTSIELAARTAKRLNLGEVKYKVVWETEDGPRGLCRGEVMLDKVDVPHEHCTVRHVLGKRRTKEQLAEKLHKWMEANEKKQEALERDLLDNPSGESV